jgi:hypothetical protein
LLKRFENANAGNNRVNANFPYKFQTKEPSNYTKKPKSYTKYMNVSEEPNPGLNMTVAAKFLSVKNKHSFFSVFWMEHHRFSFMFDKI